MLQFQRHRALLLPPMMFLIALNAGCSGSLEESDGTQLALDEVRQNYSDPEQVQFEVTRARRRADAGWTVDIMVAPVEGNVEPDVHEVDLNPDGVVVGHSKNGQEMLSDE